MRDLGIGSAVGRVSDPGDFRLATEQRVAARLGAVVLNLMGRRVASMPLYVMGLPGRCAALLDPEHKGRTIAWNHDVYYACVTIKDRTLNAWREVIARSPFKLLYVQKASPLT